LLLYRDDESCKNTIELFRAADVKVIVVRSQIDTLTPEELQEIEQVEAPIAKEYGACHWTKTTTKSGTSADELKEYILSLDVKADDTKKNGIYWYRDGRNGVEKEVQVVAIDRTVKPPSFTIRVDGRDIETEAHRLSLHKSSLSAADDIKKDGPVMSPQDAQCLGLDRMRLADGHFQMFQYDQALTLDGGVVELRYPLNTEKFSAQPLQDVSVRVKVEAAGAIGPVYSPTHDVTVLRRGKLVDSRAVAGTQPAEMAAPSHTGAGCAIGIG
jgi:hypothetical protein